MRNLSSLSLLHALINNIINLLFLYYSAHLLGIPPIHTKPSKYYSEHQTPQQVTWTLHGIKCPSVLEVSPSGKGIAELTTRLTTG